MNAVETHGLEKRYGAHVAVQSFDMHVEAGDIYGFVGRNGAGKTTVLKMLCGLAKPTIGDIILFDGAKDASERIGALIETPALLPTMSAYQNLAIKALALGVVNREISCKNLLEYVGLEKAGDQKVRTFSLGMKQRLGIAMAMVGSPDLLLLDEPMNGLDPEGSQKMRTLLVQLVESTGMTLIISSHVIDRLSRIATRYGIIKNGTLVSEQTAQEIEKKCEGRLHVRTRTPERTVALLLENLPNAVIQAQPDDSILLSNCNDDEVSRLLYRAEQEILELSHVQYDREAYFVSLMGDGEAVG